MNARLKLWPSGRRVSWDRHGVTLPGPEQQSELIPWAHLQEPQLGWGSLHLVYRSEVHSEHSLIAYRLCWLWPWQAWQLYRNWHHLWLEAQLSGLQREVTVLKARIQQRYLRIQQAQELQSRAQALFSQYAPLGHHALPQRSQHTLTFLRCLAEMESEWLEKQRRKYMRQQLKHYHSLFEAITSNPLTLRQREACITDESATLVLAGAGSGKTSVLVARAAYLLASGQAKPHEILLLAYGKQAANEMATRLARQMAGVKIEATTFHGLGLRILGQDGEQLHLSPLATEPAARRRWLTESLLELWRDPDYLRSSVTYLCHYLYPRLDPMAFSSAQALRSRLQAESIRSLKGEEIPTLGEVEIANWLFVNGIEYRYQLTPDAALAQPARHGGHFYLSEWGLAIEYYLLDSSGNVPVWLDGNCYRELPARLEKAYAARNMKHLALFHWQWSQGVLVSSLAQGLHAFGFQWHPLPDEAVLATLGEMGRLTEWLDQLSDMLGHYKAGCFDRQRLKRQVAQCSEPKRARAALTLLQPIYQAYQSRLQTRQELDFDDMIGRALSRVEQGMFNSPWRYILVDEFQDISEPRGRLLRQLRAVHPDCSLFCVGDDWQAIYRFTGSDLSLTTHFADYFGNSAQLALDCTFRFNEAIARVANRFIQQNAAQLAKPLATQEAGAPDAITLLPHKAPNTGHQEEGVGPYEAIFRRVEARRVSQGLSAISVYLLARFRFSLPGNELIARWQGEYPHLMIQAMTIHSAKGKEADVVVIAGLNRGEYGLPSEKATHPLLDALLPALESYPYAEERRLFYVALTRARQQLFLLADPSCCSPFIHELLAGEYPIEQKEWQQWQIRVASPHQAVPKPIKSVASSGIQYDSELGARCRHCSSQLAKSGRYMLCEKCGHWEPLCPKCGGLLVMRQGGRGPFWGCRNYRGSEADSCHHSESRIKEPAHSARRGS